VLGEEGWAGCFGGVVGVGAVAVEAVVLDFLLVAASPFDVEESAHCRALEKSRYVNHAGFCVVDKSVTSLAFRKSRTGSLSLFERLRICTYDARKIDKQYISFYVCSSRDALIWVHFMRLAILEGLLQTTM